MLATDTSPTKRLIQCACAIFWCLLSGGPIFGFAALKPVLIKEHVYEYLCDIHAFSDSDDNIVAKCTDQDLKLNMMFTVAAMLTNVSAFAIGRVLDVYGPKVCGLIGAFFLYLACIVFIYSKNLAGSVIDPYMVGYASLSLGGPFAFISSFQLSNSFPKRSGTILALITGAFDASSAVFLLYRVLYNKSFGSFTLEKFFMLYLFVPTFITVAQITVMPGESYQTPVTATTLCSNDDESHGHVVSPVSSSSATPNIDATETTPLRDAAAAAPTNPRRDSIGDAIKLPYELEGEEFLVEHSGGVFGVLHGRTAVQQMKTWWFVLTTLFSVIMMLRINYFVATIGTQYQYIFGSVELSDSLNKFFDVALPLGGIISIPFIGLFLDHCSSLAVLTGLLIISITIGVLGLVSNYALAVVGVCIFVAYRPLFYTTISDLSAKIFGFETFGTVYGAIMCISGVFNFGQAWLDELTHTTFKMDPIPINVILLLVTCVISGATIGYIYRATRK
ncbi:Protein FMP42 [Candida viswanathii]|uniref:Protein FMP42 n=1 Tax=Candida viswanathii TaxID=5486 RepID=A0A367YHM7_9ASCO|nr:Protein FMP42 [Candida viswanathii]